MQDCCKKCKHCRENLNHITMAYGGCTYTCDLLNNKVVGHYDIVTQKYSAKNEYRIKGDCKHYSIKEQLCIEWKRKVCGVYTFELENDDFIVKGGHHSTSQLKDATWCGVINKKRNRTFGELFYLKTDYAGFLSEKLNNEIINLLMTNCLA